MNTLGAIIGFLIYKSFKKLMPTRLHNKLNDFSYPVLELPLYIFSSLPDVSFSSMNGICKIVVRILNAFYQIRRKRIFNAFLCLHASMSAEKKNFPRTYLLFLTCYFYFLLIIMLIFTLHIHSDSGLPSPRIFTHFF